MTYYKMFMWLKHAPEIRGCLKKYPWFSELLTQIRRLWNAGTKSRFSGTEFHIQHSEGLGENGKCVHGLVTRKINIHVC